MGTLLQVDSDIAAKTLDVAMIALMYQIIKNVKGPCNIIITTGDDDEEVEHVKADKASGSGPQIMIKPLFGTTVFVPFDPDMKIELLKLSLPCTELIPVDQQMVCMDGKRLDDGATLSACGVQPGSTLRMAARLRGGVKQAVKQKITKQVKTTRARDQVKNETIDDVKIENAKKAIDKIKEIGDIFMAHPHYALEEWMTKMISKATIDRVLTGIEENHGETARIGIIVENFFELQLKPIKELTLELDAREEDLQCLMTYVLTTCYFNKTWNWKQLVTDMKKISEKKGGVIPQAAFSSSMQIG